MLHAQWRFRDEDKSRVKNIVQLLCSCAVGFLSCAVVVRLDLVWFSRLFLCSYISRFRSLWKTEKTVPTTPLEFTELYRLPPLPNRPGKLLQLPPLEFTELYRLPSSSKSPWKTAQTTPPPPSNSPNFTDYPLFQIALKNCSNYPPWIHRTLPTTPFQISPPWNSPDFVQLEKILRITSDTKYHNSLTR